MAIAIKSIPVLNGSVAAKFDAKAKNTYITKKGSVDFSKQVTKANTILAKSKI